MHQSFTENEGAHSLRLNGKTYKYCYQCGLRLQGVPRRLENHYRSFHRGVEAAWLPYEELPINCYASNFEDYLANPDTELQRKPLVKCGGAGRPLAPRPPLFTIINPVVSDIDSWCPKRQRLDPEMVSQAGSGADLLAVEEAAQISIF